MVLASCGAGTMSLHDLRNRLQTHALPFRRPTHRCVHPGDQVGKLYKIAMYGCTGSAALSVTQSPVHHACSCSATACRQFTSLLPTSSSYFVWHAAIAGLRSPELALPCGTALPVRSACSPIVGRCGAAAAVLCAPAGAPRPTTACGC